MYLLQARHDVKKEEDGHHCSRQVPSGCCDQLRSVLQQSSATRALTRRRVVSQVKVLHQPGTTQNSGMTTVGKLAVTRHLF